MSKKKTSSKKVSNPDMEKTQKYKIKKKGKKTNKSHPKLRKAIKIFFIIVILLCIIGAGLIAGLLFGLFGDDLKIAKEELTIANENSTVYDKNGGIIAQLNGDENRKIISKADMPKHLVDAFISIEDERFETHMGVDIKRTGAAVLTYIFNGGDSSFGGSTITQQLVKNLTQEKESSGLAGIMRKVKEMAKAFQIERMISKDEILELYLNLIPLGGGGKNVSGVEVAAQYYFSKSAKDLELAESAFLAGINHSPNRYNVFKDEEGTILERAKTRTKTVLAKMKELGKINEEEYNQAVEKVENGLVFKEGNIQTARSYSYHTAAAINDIIAQLMEEKGWSREFAESRLFGGGYNIYTTQDTSIQTRMEEEFKESKYIIKSKENKDENGNWVNSQAAMVIIDHTNGQVVGTVGGLGTNVNSLGQNRATQSTRQPGSSIKPIAVVAPALEAGIITAGTVYEDVQTYFGTYDPKNYNYFRGTLTVRSAVETSQNVPFVKIMSELGAGNSIDFLRKMGVTSLYKNGEHTIKNDESLPLALGGISDGISPLEMAAAYATIANGGEYITPIFFTKVTDSQGKLIIESEQTKQRVMSSQNAFIVQDMLKQVVDSGTATLCKMSGFDVGAKTGTTNGDKDRWLCGFTPYYSAAVWYGFDTPETVVFGGTSPATRIWAAVIKDVHKGLTGKRFEEPTGIVRATICKASGKLATEECVDKYTEIFVKGNVPTDYCEGHVKVAVCTESGKVANEYCPLTEEKVYNKLPEKEEHGNWKSNYGGKYGDIPTEVCDIHTKPAEEPKEENPNTNEEPEPETVIVPNVVGLNITQAQKRLEDKGLKVEIKYDNDETKTNGVVLKQSVPKDSTVEKGRTIILTVNKKEEGNNTEENPGETEQGNNVT